MKGLEIDLTAKKTINIEIVSIRTSNEISLIKMHVSTIYKQRWERVGVLFRPVPFRLFSVITAQVAWHNCDDH